ncbi:MAG: OmpA family protein [Hyphomicrobiaceae bacterium]|nr:OmpA family protein [Hyphomicrobiaceae bacterium]
MRCNPWRWLWGLIPLVILGWLTVLWERAPIEGDLSARSSAALDKAGLDWGTISFDGRDGTLEGRALSEGQPALALETVRGVWGVRIVEDGIDLLDKVDTYVWSARSDGESITLAGYVPSEQLRAEIIALARKRIAAVDVVDKMQLGRGAPEAKAWTTAIGFAFDRLAQLKAGEVGLSALDLTVAGEARNFSAYKSAKAALRNALPASVKLVADKVTPPVVSPYVWSARRTAAQLVLSGHVPSDIVHDQIFELAKNRFPKLVIIDRMEIAAGAEATTAEAIRALIGLLEGLSDGEAAISGTSASVKGEATDADAARRIGEAAVASVPQPYRVATDITFPKPKPPVVSPYTTSLTYSGGEVVLSGYVPSEEARAGLVKRLRQRFEGRQVRDTALLGSGEDPTWLTCFTAGLDGLARLSSGTVELQDRAVALRGRSDNESLPEALSGELRAAANRACETSVDIALDVPPEPDLAWRASHDGAKEVVLEGEVPDRATQTSLAEAAGRIFPGARVVDRTTVASGRSEKWSKVAQTGLALVAKLRKGEARLERQELVVAGEARDASIAAAVRDSVQNTLPRGYAGRDAIEVRSDAMIWAETEAKRRAEEDARRQREESAARLAAEEKARADAEARATADRDAAAEAAERRRREDEAQRAAEQWEADRQRAADEKVAEERRAEEKKRQDAAAADRAVRQRAANECQSLLASAAAAGVIQFRFASAALDPSSHATLGRLVEIAETCPQFRIEIEGHTDAEGEENDNQALSERRAQAVVDYLTAAGLAAGRLKAVGYGETRPVAPNDTSSNRARNRRIAFSVRID